VEAKGLALRFAAAGAQVILGSRQRDRAAATAAEYSRLLGEGRIEGASNSDMLSRCGLAFLTVPFDQALSAVDACRSEFPSGLVLVDVTVPMKFKNGQADYVEQERGSNSEVIAAHLPAGVDLVAAFKTIPAHVLSEIDQPLDCDVFVCGESPGAKQTVMEAARMIPTLRPVDAGPLRNARILERMTVLVVQLNRRYKSKGARFRVVGI
jgi:hypothetical protein